MEDIRSHRGLYWAVWACVAVLLMAQAAVTIPAAASGGFVVWVFAQQAMRAAFWALCAPWIWAWHTRWPFSGAQRWPNLLRHLGYSVGLGMVFFAVRLPILALLPWGREMAWNWMAFLNGFNLRNLVDPLIYWTVLIAGQYLKLERERQAGRLREVQLGAQLAAAELAALKQQLHPHFLFNCLNAVSALMRDGQTDRAVEALAKLSGLMRALMQNAGVQEVALAREVDYVQRYLDLERLRFDERLDARFDLEDETLTLMVPTLVLQPLVENAIKHGIAGRRSPGRVTVRAHRVRGRLVLEVENDPAERSVDREKPAGQGLGLAATRDRLAKMFGTEVSVETSFARDAPARVRLTLPCRQNPDHY